MTRNDKKKIDGWIADRLGKGHLFDNQLLYDFFKWMIEETRKAYALKSLK